MYYFLEMIYTYTRMDNGLPELAIYMDISIALHDVDHDILLDKLYSYDVISNTQKSIKSK